MLRALSAGFLIVIVGCASGGSTRAVSERCAPMVSDTLLAGTAVYPACGVGTQARLSSAPIRPQYNVARRTNCVSAHVTVVVDQQGRVVPRTARVVRATDNELSNAMLAALPALRFTPAARDGQPVAQLVDVQWMVASRNARC